MLSHVADPVRVPLLPTGGVAACVAACVAVWLRVRVCVCMRLCACACACACVWWGGGVVWRKWQRLSCILNCGGVIPGTDALKYASEKDGEDPETAALVLLKVTNSPWCILCSTLPLK